MRVKKMKEKMMSLTDDLIEPCWGGGKGKLEKKKKTMICFNLS